MPAHKPKIESLGKAADHVLYLSRTQYREFSALAKQIGGCVLDVKTFSEMRGWGAYNPLALGVWENAASSQSVLHEHATISIANRINLRQFRASKRPEIDWFAIPNELVFKFVFWHEMGHRLYNFCPFNAIVRAGSNIYPKVRLANEVLADRYAWKSLFSEKALPVRSDVDDRRTKQIDAVIDDLFHTVGIREFSPQSLPAGQYKHVPISMLKTKSLAAYVGPEALIRKSPTIPWRVLQ